MATNGTTTRPMTATALSAAKLSFAAAATFLTLLAVLHVIKPECDPSWNMISQYEIGRYGWIMQLAFLCIALSCASLVAAIPSQVRTVGGRIGLAFLLLSAIGMTIAAFGTADPITATRDEMTAHGSLHGLGATLGIPSLPIAAVLISLSLGRNQAWSSARRALLWTAHSTWLSILAILATLVVLLPQNGGKFGPGVAVGWPNRLYIIACCVWLMAVAWNAFRLQRQQ
jgi:hypothetical protein